MRLEIKIRIPNFPTIKIVDMDKQYHQYGSFDIKNEWYKIIIPSTRYAVTDILVDGESIRHYINCGTMTEAGYEIWIHGDLSQYFARVSECIAQDDLLSFRSLEHKYLICESWNEQINADFVPNSVKQFFAKGEGPHWYHKDAWHELPYETYNGKAVSSEINLDEDLLYEDKKFYGKGTCKSLQSSPMLPTIKVDDIKSESLRNAMQAFGFTEILQMQVVKLEPNSALPVHRDDWTYQSARHLMEGPSQLYFILSGNKQDIKFKFKDVGLIDVDKPIFVNNQGFVHSLVYTGNTSRSVLLVYGVRPR